MQCVKCGFFLEPLEKICQKCGYKPGDPLKPVATEVKDVVHTSSVIHPFPKDGSTTVRRNGQILGCFTLEEVNQGLKENRISLSDQAQISDHDWAVVRKLEGITIPPPDDSSISNTSSIAQTNSNTTQYQSNTLVPGWTRFTPLSADEIEEQVSQALTKQAKKAKKLESGMDWGYGCFLIVIAFVAWLIPIIGWMISICAGIAGVLLFFRSFFVDVQSWTTRAESHLVTGQSHNRRNSAKGNCPICNQEIVIYDAVAIRDVKCPICTGLLDVANYMVKPK